MLNKSQFIELLCSSFPYMETEIKDEDYDGLFSLQIGVFRQFTQSAIDQEDIPTLENHINFVLNYFEEFSEEVENSIVLQYIDKLNFKNISPPTLFTRFKEALESKREEATKDEEFLRTLSKLKSE